MAMAPRIINNSSQTKRRTLRSNYNHPFHNNNPIYPAKNDNVVNEIKFEIEHQQANNSTKSSFPLQDDIKPFQQLIPQHSQPCISIQNLQDQTYVSERIDSNMSVLRPSENSHQDAESSIEKQLHPFEVLQKRQTYLETPPPKSCSKAFKKTQSSPFERKIKSYRKIKKNHNRFVPFRKCQDQLENRIVGMINKICQDKHNEREVQIFCDKLIKISFKDMYNPYVISGIHTIMNLLLEKSLQPHDHSLLKLNSQVKNLSKKIWQELGKVSYYEDILQHKESVDLEVARAKIVRKIYKMLIQQRKCEPIMARSKSFEFCDAFLTKCNHQTSEEDLIDFLKEQKFLQI